MNIEQSIAKMKKIQDALLKFLEEESNDEENYQNFKTILSNQKISESKYKLKSVLRLISKIGNHHHRTSNFIKKNEQILTEMKKEIKKRLSNSEIFKIFKNSKITLLFLIREQLLKIDEEILNEITNEKHIKFKYPQFFSPEIKPLLTEEFINKNFKDNNVPKWVNDVKEKVPKDFEEKRSIGENENFLCELIRSDKLKEFVNYVTKNDISLNGYIPESIFETNPLLFRRIKVKIIEYASFFGSFEIIKYLVSKNVELIPSMWLFHIHSENGELTSYLIEKNLSPRKNKFNRILKESIKCHQNDFAHFIINFHMDENDLKFDIENNFNNNMYRYSIQYHNYCFFPDDIKYKYMFCYLCEFDYFELVSLYLRIQGINLNEMIIQIKKNYK